MILSEGSFLADSLDGANSDGDFDLLLMNINDSLLEENNPFSDKKVFIKEEHYPVDVKKEAVEVVRTSPASKP